MSKLISTDICVIGGGVGGVLIASAISQMGIKTIVVESQNLGGERLNGGSIKTFSLLSIGRLIEQIRSAQLYGVKAIPNGVDYDRVLNYIERTIKEFEPDYSQERLEGLGVNLIFGQAKFLTKKTLQAAENIVTAKRFIIATGSCLKTPKIDGLDEVPFYTNETILKKGGIPKHLIILGSMGGGLQLAQAFSLLGSKVTIIEKGRVLSKEDPELVNFIYERCLKLGINIYQDTNIKKVKNLSNRITIALTNNKEEKSISGSHLVLCGERVPNIKYLNLAVAGVDFSNDRVKVDKRLRTTNKNIFAIGDVVGHGFSEGRVENHAEVIIKNILFFIPATIDEMHGPRLVLTSPELAQVGLTESQAREVYKKIRVMRWPYSENYRAQIEASTSGLIKVIALENGKILGAGLVGDSAGDLIHIWTLAIESQLKLSLISKMKFPFMTLGGISRQVAKSFFISNIFNKKNRLIANILKNFR